ncbi:MAG: hypothetical protein VB021_09345 [Oscillospiraceae bacterium]|nr:hypothetical protein [Oscillospiraceae bacterium]
MIKIVYAYGDLLGLYGEYANVKALQQRLESAGETVEVETVHVGDNFRLTGAQLFYVGAGTEGKMLAALEDINEKKSELLAYLENGGLALATGNALAMFGGTVVDADGASAKGLGFGDFGVRIDDKRRYGEFIARCDLVREKVVGSINTSLTVVSREKPMFDIEFASAPILQGATEGIVKNNFYGTELSGPLLVRNPALLDVFAEKVAGRALPRCTDGWYEFAWDGYRSVLETLDKASKRKKR